MMASAGPMDSPEPIKRHSKGASQSTVTSIIICEGWLLKKRRKKMQGFARRYFTLYQTGLLSYSFDRGKPTRDHLSVPHAAVSTYPGRKDVHIDSQSATFHLRCLTVDDFNKWMTAFRTFITTDSRRSSVGYSTPRVSHLSKSAAVVEEMGATIAELDTAIACSWEFGDANRQRGSASKKGEKEKHKDKGRGLFKRSSSHHSEPNEAPTEVSPHQRVQVALERLKTQHATIVNSLQTMTHSTDHSRAPSVQNSLSATAEEPEEYQDGYSLGTDNDQGTTRFATPYSRKSTRASISTTFSDGTQEWYDAGDGGEEFELDLSDEPEPTPSVEKSEGQGGLGSNTDTGSRSSLGGSSGSSKEDLTRVQIEEIDPAQKALQIVRRTELPSGPVGDEGSLFAVLKKSVGKDLSSVALPVSFNEPITLLQNAAEQLEYYDLLSKAAETQDPVERMSYIAAFAVSGYAHTRHRSGRKSFTPMLAETFEDVRTKFIAEKVQHNPFVMAYHAEGEGWELYATNSGKTKFWGKSLEVIPLGATHLKIDEDHFEWNKPSSFMRNLMVGTKYLEHNGRMTIENRTTGARSVLTFKESGYWGPSNQVEGTVLSSSGDVQTKLEGKWDEVMAQTLDSSNLRVLWRVTPYPRRCPEVYGFTNFGITLNEITPDIEGKLPPTDSRLRPDVRALEEGDTDEAEEQKQTIEDMQRDRRKRGKDRGPVWFKQVGEEWVYKGGYWEARAKDWEEMKVEPLW
ncbi:hypothetical protein FIBSPDRAFT_812623 [Athelia psychrophila]|uniref:PH domain-containing protein n=1 Tax=Athelia psychrophila TaxID=1759441 RepID=A0A166V405_9AGAM|nr:hypothetical protein FIBSPDRAFT_812623 [Fibularhizoctonia sp. CBS 109695]